MRGAQEILGALILKPALLEAADLSADDFAPGRERDTFTTIAALHEDLRSDRIDLVLLADRLGDNGAASYVTGLVHGNYAGSLESFRARVALYRQKTIKRRILAAVQAQAAGDDIDLEAILPDIERYRQLAGSIRDPGKALLTGAELQALDIQIEWTVDKLIPARSLTLLHGPGGLGKTWLALCLSKAVSEGAPFLGLSTRKRPVVYVDYENPLPLLIERLRQLNISDVRFWHLSADPRPPKLDGDDWARYKALPPGSLIVFDTVRAAHDGDENSSQDAGLVMGRLKEIRELGNDVLLLHHVPKADERQYKGATTWSDLADHVLAFHKVRRETLEELDEGGFDPHALLALGTGSKTRFEPCRLYITLDPEAGGFKLAQDPKLEAIRAIADHIAAQGAGSNQSEIIAWAKEAGVGPKMRAAFIALLKRGEREGHWRAVQGFRGARVYEPPTCP